jgi:ribosome biogenesis GTPase / thiamine phosphate phosphatase
MPEPDTAQLGWTAELNAEWGHLGSPQPVGRVSRLDRGWSTVLCGAEGPTLRVRNIGADVAVGDWVVVSPDEEKVDRILRRSSAFVRRASFEGARAESHTLAANVDTVYLLHALSSPINPRRLERELVLTFDSGASPAIVLTKADATSDAEEVARYRSGVEDVALGVPVFVVSSRERTGLDALRAAASGAKTVALLGSSGVGKSTLVNALVGREIQRTAEVRDGDQRGRHTTVAAELVRLPGSGWLIDTPGLRAVSLWRVRADGRLSFPELQA